MERKVGKLCCGDQIKGNRVGGSCSTRGIETPTGRDQFETLALQYWWHSFIECVHTAWCVNKDGTGGNTATRSGVFDMSISAALTPTFGTTNIVVHAWLVFASVNLNISGNS